MNGPHPTEVHPGDAIPRRRRTGRVAGGLRLAVLAGALAGLAPPAGACPVCKGETGAQVRAGIFDENFASNLLAALLPFGVFLGITAAIHFGPAARGGPGEGRRGR